MQSGVNLPIELVLVVFAALILLSVLSSRASALLGIPGLILFLLIGMVAGSEGPGGIHFDDPQVAQWLGVVALIFILFAGGLSTRWSDVRPILRSGFLLSTVGVLVTAVGAGWFASFILGLPLLAGVLLGSIISSTDAAAVFSILRSRSVSLKGQLRPLLELESGSNDPMAVFLTLGLTGIVAAGQGSLVNLVPMFVSQMTVGALVGYGSGRLSVVTLNRLRLEYDGLYPVLLIALVLLTYGVATLLWGNGFLAVYVAGITLGNRDFIHKNSLMRFCDGLAWLMQITMFLTLGLLVFPSHLVPVIPSGLLMAAFLILVARPVAVFLTLAFEPFSIREKLLISWVGLRGAVPIILATFPLLAGAPDAEMFFNIVFFVVLGSVLLQGTTLPWLAKVLKLDTPAKRKPVATLEFIATGKSKNDLVEVHVPPDSPAIGKQLVDLSLPADVLIVLISRHDEVVVPRGNTVVLPEDMLLVLADKSGLDRISRLISSPGG